MIKEIVSEKEIGLEIAKIMNEKGISQRKLAELSGVSENTIFNLLKGSYHHKLDTYIRLCNALDTTIYCVIFGK